MQSTKQPNNTNVFLLMNIMSHVTIIIMQEDIISQVGKRFKDERLKEKVMKYLKFPTPKNQGICRYNTLQSPVDMGL